MSRKEAFLSTYDREHQTTMRVLRAFPADKLDFKPHERSNTAQALAWTFVLERGLARKIWNDEFAKGMPAGKMPGPPDSWDAILEEFEKVSADYRSFIAAASEEDLGAIVHFFVAPKTMGEMTRHDMIWFMLHDEIHHRGQLSVYLRMVGGKVPSIYGPSADEPWM